MRCNQICKWNSNAGCVKPYGVPCILENVPPIGKKATNADRIRSMTDEELNELFHDIYNAGAEDAVAYEWGQRTNSFEWTMDWLQHPAE